MLHCKEGTENVPALKVLGLCPRVVLDIGDRVKCWEVNKVKH
jgi:hypothetical protein